MDHRAHLVLRPRAPRRPRRLRAPLAHGGPGPAGRRTPARRGYGDRRVHRHGCHRRRPAGDPAGRSRRGHRSRRAVGRVRQGERRRRARRATSSRRCRRSSAAASTSSPGSCPTCRHPACRCSSATRSRSSPGCPTTVARTEPTSSGGSWPTARASSGAAARCCWSSAATRPTCSGPDLDRLGYDDVELLLDEEADVRGIEATLSRPPVG